MRHDEGILYFVRLYTVYSKAKVMKVRKSGFYVNQSPVCIKKRGFVDTSTAKANSCALD